MDILVFLIVYFILYISIYWISYYLYKRSSPLFIVTH